MSNRAISAITPNSFNANNMNMNTNTLSNALGNTPNAISAPASTPVAAPIVGDISKSSGETSNVFFYFIIIFLLLTILGVNVFIMLSDVTDETIRNSGPFMQYVYRLIGYPVGEIIKSTTNVAGKGLKKGIDITTGTVEETVNTTNRLAGIEKDVIENENQISNLNKKQKKYCYVGSSESVNTCATIDESGKCMSGKIFDTRKKCMDYRM
jgi:hypothetical protein